MAQRLVRLPSLWQKLWLHSHVEVTFACVIAQSHDKIKAKGWHSESHGFFPVKPRYTSLESPAEGLVWEVDCRALGERKITFARRSLMRQVAIVGCHFCLRSGLGPGRLCAQRLASSMSCCPKDRSDCNALHFPRTDPLAAVDASRSDEVTTCRSLAHCSMSSCAKLNREILSSSCCKMISAYAGLCQTAPSHQAWLGNAR